MEGTIQPDYKLGDTLDTKLKFKSLADIDWTVEGSLLEICGDYTTLLGANVKDILWNSPPLSDKHICQKYDFIVDPSVAVAD
jgi:hypothetical protein